MACSYIGVFKNEEDETFEYGLKIEKQDSGYVGTLSAIITKGHSAEQRSEPTIILNAKEMEAGNFEATTLEGVKGAAAEFINKTYNQEVFWKEELF